MVGDTLEDRVKKAEERVSLLRTSLLGMVESYDMLMKMPLPPTMADVIRSVFMFEVPRARYTINQSMGEGDERG